MKLFNLLILFLIILSVPPLHICAGSAEGTYTITFHYSGVAKEQQTITIDFADEWLLMPENEYNHKLMQASFGLAAAGFRDKEHDLSQKDFNIRDFFSQLDFANVQTEDFDRITSIDTIGTAIASKNAGGSVIIAVSVSGNNYQNEWESNLTVDDENRPNGFNSAADKVWDRLLRYLETNGLKRNLRLWISGYSRAAAVSNIVAADAVDSGLFEAVYGYTIATPRTTKDTDAGNYPSIFNIINPFDPVPMVPFPEWGFVRYGTDLFLPSRETDSRYAVKKARADEYCMRSYGHALHYNPLVNSQLHTLMDCNLFFMSSAHSYKETFQNATVDFWKNRDLKKLLNNISEKVINLPEITNYQITEFFDLLDYLMQITYTNFTSQVFRSKKTLWDPALTLQENIMHEHYDEVYRSWLFSSDDPDDIFQNDPRYVHYAVYGDIDVELYDSHGDFIFRIDRTGDIVTDPAKAKNDTSAAPGKSDADLFASRQDLQTLIIFPMDQVFSAVIFSHEDGDIQTAYLEYTAKELRADVQYVLDETVKKDEAYPGSIDPETIRELNDEELLAEGFRKVEPWSKDIVYSPGAVMRLENTGIFHPSPLIFLTFGGLAFILILYILVLGLIGTGNGVRKSVKAIRRRRADAKAGVKNNSPYDRLF